MATYSSYYNPTSTALQGGLSINDSRRMYNFGDRIAELNPIASPFFAYLSKVAKQSTDDPVFKFLEQRHQWQRRNFHLAEAVSSAAYTADTTYINDGGDDLVQLACYYDQYGRTSATAKGPKFLIEGQVVAFHDTNGTLRHFKVDATPTVSATYSDTKLIALFSATCAFASGVQGQVVGSGWAEGSTDPDGWQDQMYDREGYCQIFKTAIDLFSGTALATKHRGISNEYKRVWMEKLMEHKMDIEHATLFGYGRSDDTAQTAPTRYTWGLMPYTTAYGTTQAFTYASSGYDDFMDFLEGFFAPESGNSMDKLVLTSRKVLSWMNKLGEGNFINNIVSSNQYQLDVQNIKGAFGHSVTKVNTIFGNLHFVQEPLLRNGFEDYALVVDLKNVKYRPLAGNGVSRDTHIITNVQNNNVDGRKDIIMTEAGLEISLPETHAVLQWS